VSRGCKGRLDYKALKVKLELRVLRVLLVRLEIKVAPVFREFREILVLELPVHRGLRVLWVGLKVILELLG
jgi:hypothetical protein